MALVVLEVYLVLLQRVHHRIFPFNPKRKIPRILKPSLFHRLEVLMLLNTNYKFHSTITIRIEYSTTRILTQFSALLISVVTCRILALRIKITILKAVHSMIMTKKINTKTTILSL